MRFFKPTSAFWEWLAAYSHQPVVDVGCGYGELVEEMHAKGVKAMGVDSRFLVEELPPRCAGFILPRRAELAADLFEGEMTVICCRPSHTGFPAAVIRKLKAPCRFFYIGFAKNLMLDLGYFAERAALEAERVGEDGESVYYVRLNNP